jgi:copper chaperone CopZ
MQACLVQAIEEAGFGCSPLGSGEAATLQLAVGGMVCSSCSAAVEAALRGTEGVLEASISLLANKAEVGGVARDWQGAEGVRAGRKAACMMHAEHQRSIRDSVPCVVLQARMPPPAACTGWLYRCGTIQTGWAPASSSQSCQRQASRRSPPLTSMWTAPRCDRGRRGCVQQRWLPNGRGGRASWLTCALSKRTQHGRSLASRISSCSLTSLSLPGLPALRVCLLQFWKRKFLLSLVFSLPLFLMSMVLMCVWLAGTAIGTQQSGALLPHLVLLCC